MNGNIPVYIVDDSTMVCFTLQKTLDHWGYESIDFSDSVEARDFLLTAPSPYLAIIDWEMPELQGTEIVSQIRKTRPDDPLYLILLTGRMEKDDFEFAIDAGADDFIRKPFDEKELRGRLKAATRIVELELRLFRQRQALDIMNQRLKHSLKVLESDIEAGQTVQRKLLPQNNVQFGEIAVDYLFWPSKVLSGDFLDYALIDQKSVCFYFADVSGHGASSAFLTVLLKSFFYNQIYDHAHGFSDTVYHPDKLMKELNEYILSLNLKKHLVLFYGVINIDTHSFSFSSAGQFPFPILIGGGQKKYLEEKELPLGVYAKAEYKRVDCILENPFSLVLFSDGVLEIIASPLQSDKEAILIERYSDQLPLEQWLEMVSGKVDRERLPDDVTILRLSSVGSGKKEGDS